MASNVDNLTQDKTCHLNYDSSGVEETFLRACRDCDYRAVEKLLRDGEITSETINTRDSKTGYTGLMTVVGFPKCDLDIVKLLLAQPGINVNMTSYHGGNTALMIATVYGRHEIIKCLLERSDIRTDIMNAEGETAMDMAKKQDKNLIFGMFREKAGEVGTSTMTVEDYKEGDFHSMTFQSHKPKEDMKDKSYSHSSLNHAFHTFSDMKQAMQEQWTGQIRNNIDQVSVSISERHMCMERKLQALQASCDIQKKKIQEQTDAEKKKVEDKYRKEIQELTDKLDSLRGELEKAEKCCKEVQLNNMRSEFECRVCGIEMVPPMMIYQCVDGHPICGTCRHSPEITKCPDCRGHLAGRSLTLEKIARTIF